MCAVMCAMRAVKHALSVLFFCCSDTIDCEQQHDASHAILHCCHTSLTDSQCDWTAGPIIAVTVSNLLCSSLHLKGNKAVIAMHDVHIVFVHSMIMSQEAPLALCWVHSHKQGSPAASHCLHLHHHHHCSSPGCQLQGNTCTCGTVPCRSYQHSTTQFILTCIATCRNADSLAFGMLERHAISAQAHTDPVVSIKDS